MGQEARRDMERDNVALEGKGCERICPAPSAHFWSSEALCRQWAWAFEVRTLTTSRWPRQVADWHRKGMLQASGQALHRERWEDDLHGYCLSIGVENWKSSEEISCAEWAHKEEFVAYFQAARKQPMCRPETNDGTDFMN